MALPKGYIDLATAYNAPSGTFVNIIGAVVDIRPPIPTRSNEHMVTFKLLDQSLRDAVYGREGLSIRFFKADLQLLPQVRSMGDIVLLRSIKILPYNFQPMAISSYSTGVLVFPNATIPDPSYSIAFQGTNRMKCLGVPADIERLTLEEQAYIVQLKSALSATTAEKVSLMSMEQSRKRDQAPVAQSGPPVKRTKMSSFGEKFKLIEDLRHFQFADICGQVVKRFPNQFGACELYVTDYTENKDMFLYTPPEDESDYQREGDSFGYNQPSKKTWPGPYGQLVLKVNLKDPHAQFANSKINDGDIVLLKNVKMKIRNEGSKLEGDMWPDDRNPDRVLITKVTQDVPETHELRARREKYWTARKGKEAPLPPQEGDKANTKRAKKRARKQLKEATAKARAQVAEDDGVAEGAKRGDQINSYIRCSNEVTTVTAMRDILDPENLRHTAVRSGAESYVLPFVNAKYRARVRVVDFLPKPLEDFAAPPLPDGNDEPEQSSVDYMAWEASPKLEWSFDLLLEEAGGSQGASTTGVKKERMWVTLGHEEAQFLLGKDMPDPADLRNNVQLLTQLREKMCILWGNLEEMRDGGEVSNKPFECCLWEYGVEMDDDDPGRGLAPMGWRRMFRFGDTTIL
ncbi:hypothetical protein LTR08_001465 [Meristemomyces frigidus]|nr:hypothetical protein LTR08_001465 [Meristemomyces frigidus]